MPPLAKTWRQILDQNPLKVDRMAIKDTKVLETIKEGKAVYRAPPQE